VSPDALPAAIEAALGLGRQAWPLAALRVMADMLLASAEGRRISARHEARWLNLFGFALRPGFGATVDEFRMSQARRVYLAGLAFPADVQCQVEWVVLWQRIAGGLTAGQQQDLHQRYAPPLLASIARRGRRLAPQVERETWRLLASLERLPARTRTSIGGHLLARLQEHADQASLWWALGRLAARVPTYGPINTVVPPADASGWIERALALKPATPDALAALVDAAAFTGDAARDVGETVRGAVEAALVQAGAPDPLVRRLHDADIGGSTGELQRRYGETLPEGLMLVGGNTQ
jgi:hypothetical protein